MNIASLACLTRREFHVLDACCRRGMTTIEAGTALGISPQTVKNHRVSINRKLDCRRTLYACYLLGGLHERQTHGTKPAMRPVDV